MADQPAEATYEKKSPAASVGIGKELADKIATQAKMQIQTSRNSKRARLEQIRENENLYLNIVTPSIRNPFNESFPYMPGFIDHLKSKIDDDSNLLYVYQAESDLQRAQRVNAFYEKESKDPSPNASWSVKHRHAKINAMFSGVAIYSYYAEKSPDYRSCLDVISHYDFHCEPRGGAILENHLFCGQDNLFKTTQSLKASQYDQTQVASLTSKAKESGVKDNDDQDHVRNNRLYGLLQDPVTNNYVGQEVVKLVQWYTMYEGKRYYVLFHENTGVWIRCCLLTDLFPDNLYPYVTWHTNEDPDIFWSKAPADDARSVAKIINTFLNQELYNRQKINFGETHYDVEMYPNVQALTDSRPDKHVPVDTKNGSRPLSTGIYRPTVTQLSNTLELITWLEGFTGKQIGYTASSAGQSEGDKKVGIFKGEIAAVEELINVKNKSYRDALSRLGLLFLQGLQANLTKAVSVKIMGADGVEWQELTREDLKFDKPLTILPVGGTSELELKRAKDEDKVAVLESPAMVGINPQWKAQQLLLIKGFTPEEIKDAFSSDSFAKKELMSEASQAEKDIVEGKKPLLNREADSNFMQHIIDFANDAYPEATPEQYASLPAAAKAAYDKETVVYKTLIDYAIAHTDIAVENEARNIKEMIRQKRMALAGDPNAAQAVPASPIRPGVPLPRPTQPLSPMR